MFNDEVKNGINEGIAKRLSSPFYGYFLISWSLVNWKLLYVTLFISNESIVEQTGKLKIDYVVDLFFSQHWSQLFFINVTVPIVAVLFILWVFSILTFKIYKKDLENETEMQILKLQEEAKVLNTKEKNIGKEEKITAAQKRINELQEENNPKLWAEEYKKFKENNLFTQFSFIIDSVYKHNGFIQIMDMMEAMLNFEIPAKILSFAHASNLIEFENGNKQIILTEKGKYFVKKYQFEN